MDHEIEVMAAVVDALDGLDDDVRSRVLKWASERYGLPTVWVQSGGQVASSGAGKASDGAAPAAASAVAEEEQSFEHFADLFDAARPKTNEDKALVAAYWVQVIQGRDTWVSRLLNVELKNLGHAIPNITDALSSNMRRKPARVVQVTKSGSSRQANKTYKVTREGLAQVQDSLRLGEGV